MPSVITIGTDTGGVGKTTISIELAVTIARKKSVKKVAIIGFDENSESSTYLGIDVKQLPYTTADLFSSLSKEGKLFAEVFDNKPETNFLTQLDKSIVGTENIYLAPSSPKLSTAVSHYPGDDIDEKLSQYIETYLSDFNFVIVDTPPGLNHLRTNAVLAADFIIIPCQYDDKTTAAATRFIKQIKEIKGKNFNRFAILVNAVNQSKKRLIKKAKQDLGNYIEADQTTLIEIPQDVEIGIAQDSDHRKSIQVHMENSRAAEAFRQLASEIVRRF